MRTVGVGGGEMDSGAGRWGWAAVALLLSQRSTKSAAVTAKMLTSCSLCNPRVNSEVVCKTSRCSVIQGCSTVRNGTVRIQTAGAHKGSHGNWDTLGTRDCSAAESALSRNSIQHLLAGVCAVTMVICSVRAEELACWSEGGMAAAHTNRAAARSER